MNNYTLYVKYWVEDDGDYYFHVDRIGKFETVEKIKSWLDSPITTVEIDEYDEDRTELNVLTNKQEIEDCYETPEEGYEPSFEVSRCSTPYPDNMIAELKKKDIENSIGDGVYFCPYCGKYRTFYDNDEYDITCEICEVSVKNYDVKKHNDL